MALELSQEIREFLKNEYPNVDIEVNYGGQPVYYYIISAE